MTPIEELDLLLTLIRKYDLPLSPILEYAVSEKKEENATKITLTEENEEDFVETFEQVADNDSTHISVVDFDIPENADTTTRNKYLMQFCYGILSEFKDALDEREREICNRLLVENRRNRASEEYRITEERVRQIYVKSIKKINLAHKSAMKELEDLRRENEELKRRNYILEKEMENAANIENVVSLQELEDKLCISAKRLLELPTIRINFSNRTANILRAAQVDYFRDIPQLSLEQVQDMRNCGRKTIKELRDFLSKFSLDFGLSYEEIVSRLTEFVDDDFVSVFEQGVTRSNSEKAYNKKEYADDRKAKDVIDDESKSESFDEEVEVEHVFLDTNGSIEGSSVLPVCKENRSGSPWSTEEEKEISFYYTQGHSFYAIAKAIGRTEVAVMSRLGMLGLIDYTYGQDYKPITPVTSSVNDNNEENVEEQLFNGMELAIRYYYPLQDNLFWDEKQNVYEIYLADNYDIVINHLIFDFTKLKQIEEESDGLSEDEKEELFSNYWYDKHINVIARIKPNTDGYEVLKLESGFGIKSISYEAEKYVCIEHEIEGEDKFIDYNGTVYNSSAQIIETLNTEVAKHHDFYDAPNYITKEYIRLGMIEIKKIYKGNVKKVSIFTDSELGRVIKDKSEEIWMLDSSAIITKAQIDDNNSYPFKVYFCNGVKIDGGDMDVVKSKSLLLQSQLKDRISKLQSTLKKKKEWIRYERQFKEIASSMFAFEDDILDDSIKEQADGQD